MDPYLLNTAALRGYYLQLTGLRVVVVQALIRDPPPEVEYQVLQAPVMVRPLARPGHLRALL